MKNIISKNTTMIGKFNGYLDSLEVNGNLIIKDQNQTKIENLAISSAGLVELKLLLTDYVYIDGIFKGDIRAKKRIILEKNSQTFGNIQSPEIITREGAIFHGNLFLAKENIKFDFIEKKINDTITKIRQENIFKRTQQQ